MCTPEAPGSCLGAALKPVLGHYHSASFCRVVGAGSRLFQVAQEKSDYPLAWLRVYGDLS